MNVCWHESLCVCSLHLPYRTVCVHRFTQSRTQTHSHTHSRTQGQAQRAHAPIMRGRQTDRQQAGRQTGCQAATATASSSSSQSNLRAYKREQKIVIYSTCFMPNANENSNLFIFNIKCLRLVPNACPVTCKRVCKS